MSDIERPPANEITRGMLTPKIVITGIAVLIAVVSAAILRKQATARACPVHNRYAGILATIIGGGLLVVSLGSAVYTRAFS